MLYLRERFSYLLSNTVFQVVCQTLFVSKTASEIPNESGHGVRFKGAKAQNVVTNKRFPNTLLVGVNNRDPTQSRGTELQTDTGVRDMRGHDNCVLRTPRCKADLSSLHVDPLQNSLEETS